MKRAQKTRFDRGVIQWSVILYIALLLPISLLHESGHASVCSAEGFGYSLWLDGMGGHTLCAGVPANSIAYGAMGGIFGILGSGAIIAFWALVKRRPAILVVGLAFAADQFAKMILEGFFIRAYASGATDLFLTALQLVSWLGLTFYFAKRPLEKAAELR